jgi:HK97 gp10 family phage protein
LASAVRYSSRIPEIIAENPQRATALAKMIADRTTEAAKGAAPVETGALKESLHIEGLENQGGAAVMAVWYWFFLEFGTVNAPAKPFLLPAFEAAVASLPVDAKAVFAGL